MANVIAMNDLKEIVRDYTKESAFFQNGATPVHELCLVLQLCSIHFNQAELQNQT